jgi:hypothetical protein
MSMDLSTVQKPTNALELLKTYVALPEAERTDHDRVMILLLSRLESNDHVIDVQATIAAGGYTETGEPNLALARADWSECYLYRSRTATRYQPGIWPSHRATTYSFPSPEGTPEPDWMRNGRMCAVVPPIPPEHRPKRWRLRQYLILWEAEWALKPLPPGDPALLRPIGPGGRLAVVEHVWDPTPLELLALGLR